MLRYVVEKGSIARRRRRADRHRARRRQLLGVGDPAHAGGHDPGQPRPGRPASTSRPTCSRSTSSGCWPAERRKPGDTLTADEPWMQTLPRGCTPSSVDSPFATVEEAIEDIRAGRMVVVVDSPDRENEGDLVMAAEYVTPEADQLHGPPRPRPDLPDADARALRRARPADDDRAQPTRRSGPPSRSRSRPARASRPASRPPTARTPSRSPSTRRRGRTTSSSPGTCSRCARARAACSSAPARPRPPSTSPGWPGSRRPA